MMFQVNQLRLTPLGRTARLIHMGGLLLLLVCANLAGAQEGPRPAGSSQIKPPMIKPPMSMSQASDGSGVKTSSRRRGKVRRQRRGKSRLTTKMRTKREIVDVPVAMEMPVGGVPGETVSGGGSGTTSIKPPMISGSSSIKPPMANGGKGGMMHLPPGSKAPVSGGVLNGRAITLPKPAYPPIARSARASGAVVVQITIDERGDVVSASAVSGHPLLQQAAIEAAREAKFSPTLLEGQPVKVSGTLTYNFVQ